MPCRFMLPTFQLSVASLELTLLIFIDATTPESSLEGLAAMLDSFVNAFQYGGGDIT